MEKILKHKFTPVQILAIGFGIAILIGGILLTLPISSAEGLRTPFLDCIFTSTTSVCVTGLVVRDTGLYWSYFGQTVIMILVEIGGLGFMSFATLIALILGRKITLRDRLVMQEAINSPRLQGLVKLMRYLLTFTFFVQFTGALLLSTVFIPTYGIGKGIYFSIFHSVSAFCNAGLDLFGNYGSLTSYSSNATIIFTIGFLIIIGGLGFSVWAELFSVKKIKKLSLHSKVVITTTALLIVVGAMLMYLFEMNNGATMGNMGIKEKLLSSFFASVSPRTAGFNSIDLNNMTVIGKFTTIILMFIGGSPGSTAGGIKTTTFAIVIFSLFSLIRGNRDTNLYMKKISMETVLRAFCIFTVGLLIVTVSTLALTFFEPNIPFINLLYEATSAFGTVGLSLGLTPELSTGGKIIIMLTMYLGRVGGLTFALALARKKEKPSVRFPEEKILIG